MPGVWKSSNTGACVVRNPRIIRFTCASGGQAERLANRFDDLIECLGIGNGHVGQHFAIELDIGFFQAVDELAIAKPSLADSRVDTDDPELAELAFSNASIAKRIDARADDRFFGRTKQPASTAAIALGLFKESIFGSIASRTFGGSHDLSHGPSSGNKALPSFGRGSVDLPVPRAIKCESAYGGSITVPGKRFADTIGFDAVDDGRAAEVPLTFVRHPGSKVARSTLSVDGFPSCGKTETFLGPFVGFLLRHGVSHRVKSELR